jgi:hypothetical protein
MYDSLLTTFVNGTKSTQNNWIFKWFCDLLKKEFDKTEASNFFKGQATRAVPFDSIKSQVCVFYIAAVQNTHYLILTYWTLTLLEKEHYCFMKHGRKLNNNTGSKKI